MERVHSRELLFNTELDYETKVDEPDTVKQ